ncbi:MAG TPA: transposase [Bacillota bacterium]|nr:transposase [Bacillota bacterium]HPP61264.1 transposase [Bacillota bacterium]
MHTTNSTERLNEEIRRRKWVIRICPNKESVIRLAKCSAHGKGQEMEECFTWRESEILSQTHKVTRTF